LEGIPALLLGAAVLWALDDWPHDARWLTPADRALLQAALVRDRAGKPRTLRSFQYLRHPLVLLLAAILLFSAIGAYGFGLWLPTILAGVSDISHSSLALLASLPYAVSIIFMIWIGWHSDKTGERKWHTAIPLFVSAIGLAVGLAHPKRLPSAVLIYCLVGSGIYSYLPSFWSLPTRYLAGTAAAVSIGIINSIANLGGLVGPYLVGYVRAHTGSFDAALLFLSSMFFASGTLVLRLRGSGGRPTGEGSQS
jgi:ACS family tartrate transporter-like MFS transporter